MLWYYVNENNDVKKYKNNNRDDIADDKVINMRIITRVSLKMASSKLKNVNYIGNKKYNSNDKKFWFFMQWKQYQKWV